MLCESLLASKLIHHLNPNVELVHVVTPLSLHHFDCIALSNCTFNNRPLIMKVQFWCRKERDHPPSLKKKKKKKQGISPIQTTSRNKLKRSGLCMWGRKSTQKNTVVDYSPLKPKTNLSRKGGCCGAQVPWAMHVQDSIFSLPPSPIIPHHLFSPTPHIKLKYSKKNPSSHPP